MNTFKRKSLYAALAGVSALGATGAAEAVNVNPDGLGQVLIYPYYTTRNDAQGNAYNSLLSVVNTTATAKAVKVRFLEGKNSREVLDFNLFLSAFDVWTTAVIPRTGGGAGIITADKSCTLPQIPAGGVDFVNFQYTADGGGSSLDRTKEGYVEIIEMATYLPTSTTAVRITHNPPGGSPPGCAANNDTQAAADAQPLGGGLMGGMSLINVQSGDDFTEDTTALDNFFTLPTNLYNPAGVTAPDLTQATPPVSVVFNGTQGVFSSVWPVSTSGAGTDAVSAVLMHDTVLNEYVLDSGTKSGTDWVVTMPTKRFYIANGTGNAARLFQRNFNTTAGSCDDVALNIYDREEQTTSQPLTFSPPPPTTTNSICWEANVITFNNSNILGSVNVANIPTTFQNGWLRMGFAPVSGNPTAHVLANATTTVIPLTGATTTGTRTYFGLPVIGFAVQTFNNGTLTILGAVQQVQSAYGGNFGHRYTRLITP
jgi:hypothetical protein